MPQIRFSVLKLPLWCITVFVWWLIMRASFHRQFDLVHFLVLSLFCSFSGSQFRCSRARFSIKSTFKFAFMKIIWLHLPMFTYLQQNALSKPFSWWKIHIYEILKTYTYLHCCSYSYTLIYQCIFKQFSWWKIRDPESLMSNFY